MIRTALTVEPTFAAASRIAPITGAVVVLAALAAVFAWLLLSGRGNLRAFTAIVHQTIRSAFRSRVFTVLFVLLVLAVFALPMTVSGDGTAAGQVQISLTYSLGVVILLVSATTLWLSCSQLAREIEAYNLHLVTTKPCPRWIIWVGKWTGIFVMHTVILLVASAIVLGLTLYRLKHGDFSEGEMEKLRNEVLVGRRGFVPRQPDFRRMAGEEYDKRLAEGQLPEDHHPKGVKDEIQRQLRAKSTEIPPGATRFWVYQNVRGKGKDDPLFLRYRNYLGTTDRNSQKMVPCTWALRDPNTGAENGFVPARQNVMTGSHHEIPIHSRFIDETQDGLVVVSYTNELAPPEDEEDSRSIIFQIADGPTLLVREIGFVNNYLRAMILAVFQLAFLAALGCTVSSAFSTPVAAFVAVSYLAIGMTVQAAVSAPLRQDSGEYSYKNAAERAAHLLAIGTSKAVVSVDDLDSTGDLTRGRLIEWSRIGTAFLSLLVLRSGLMGALGVWILTRRELGTVIRR